ncbi:hypothetical protein PROFUN_04834 [Planoprotostelium fungivorum]|uniref:Spermine/spermidine synthase family protein n=1 Tax=Planoprotostelium fungivorum TaxID=1890364 RepID=A0A2P6NT94_9EUKA|nr:hypothetical protein PROFUN_04834 [Planoprotostelium fungivorum]
MQILNLKNMGAHGPLSSVDPIRWVLLTVSTVSPIILHKLLTKDQSSVLTGGIVTLTPLVLQISSELFEYDHLWSSIWRSQILFPIAFHFFSSYSICPSDSPLWLRCIVGPLIHIQALLMSPIASHIILYLIPLFGVRALTTSLGIFILFFLRPSIFNRRFTSALFLILCLSASLTQINKRRLSDRFIIVDQMESSTGIISIIDSKESHWRIMRCDHSMLGGLWIEEGLGEDESVHRVFSQIESARLIQPLKGGIGEKALFIGLGVGIAPKAFRRHGIHTTIVEIDPIIHHMASSHFGFRGDRVVLGDASVYVREAVTKRERYHYVIHDVFSGGTMPGNLLTLETFEQIAKILADPGVFVLNVVGNLDSPLVRTVLHTAKSVFPACRVFEEGKNMTLNHLLFCKKSGDIKFRRPIKKDFLNSLVRAEALSTMEEFEGDLDNCTRGGKIMRDEDVKNYVEEERRGAEEHWKSMREVIPSRVWNLW